MQGPSHIKGDWRGVPIVLDIELSGGICAKVGLCSVNLGFSRLFAKKSVNLGFGFLASNVKRPRRQISDKNR